MAAKSILFLIISQISHVLTQSSSPQNVQTHYPFPPTHQPVLPPPVHPAPSSQGSSNFSAVGAAIGVTAGSTLVLSGLVFFFIFRNAGHKRNGENGSSRVADAPTDPAVARIDHFDRFDGNLKGVILDENGLDVLYWRNLEDGEKSGSFKKQYFRASSDDLDRRDAVEIGKTMKEEVHLLRGMPSISQSLVWGERVDQSTITFDISSKDEENQDSIVQVAKAATPPPPPPPPQEPPQPPDLPVATHTSSMPPPPPPPPPLPPRAPISKLASESVHKGKMPAPPPPPPPTPPPPPPKPTPPPPPSGAVRKGMPGKPSSEGEGTLNHGSRQRKLKPLHWDKLNPDVQHSMVWDKLDKGSFNFDGDLMEALFGYAATGNFPGEDGASTGANTEKSATVPQIFILDPRKSQNTAIVLKTIGITRKDLINAILDGQGLNADTLEKLTKMAPNAEESSQILAYHGDPTRLADAESFLYHLLRAVPCAFTRFNALLFKLNYAMEVSQIKESLQTLESACKELRTRGIFLKLLEAVLKAGNRLNAGTLRGNAQAFNLTALAKLSDVKSSDGKTTLLQFIVQEVIRAEGKRCLLIKNRSMSRANSRSNSSAAENPNADKSKSKDDKEREFMMLGLPVVGGLSAEFSNVRKAATLDYDTLVKTSSELAAQLGETRRTVEQCGNDGGFAIEMMGFLEKAESEMHVVEETQARVIDLVKRTTDYYQTGFSSKNAGKHTLQIFVIVRDFLGMVDQVCVDIARNLQKKQPASSSTSSTGGGSSSPESPRVFRFPKLPANFMTGSSKSSSIDSDNASHST